MHWLEIVAKTKGNVTHLFYEHIGYITSSLFDMLLLCQINWIVVIYEMGPTALGHPAIGLNLSALSIWTMLACNNVLKFHMRLTA